ncbi:MAG: sugar phosphate isomerase/epimerase [Lentisphaerae bacterium]|nr:sugar phosphate isomerase/epimerase [Lentisphaerota bacterium]
MKLAIMSYTLARAKDFDLNAMCALANELKLDGVDLVTTYGKKPQELRRMLDQHGLKTVCHTFLADLIFPSTAARQAGVDTIKQGIEAAVILGTDRVMIPTPGKKGVPRDLARSYIIRGLQEALVLARQAGLTLTLENFPGATSPFAISSDLLEAVREVPGLKITFDNGNALIGGEDSAASFERCAPHIIHAHFKDWVLGEHGQGMEGLDGRWYQAALIGEGLVNHQACLQAMRRSGYPGYINIEYEGDRYAPADATRRAAGYLRQLLSNV